MTEKENVKLVQDMYAAYGRGDLPAILSTLSEGASVDHAATADVLPWAKTYRGREGWAQFFKDLGQNLDVLAFEPRQYVAQGDKVVALGWYKYSAKLTSRTFESYWAMDWTLRGGKVMGVRVYEDTAAAVTAMRRS